MGRLLSYLFEVTERFGMETRTELILLQRTMVVVEGVARSLNPHINIWEVASPIVTNYISKSIGPRGALSDLTETAKVLMRFGPRLPSLVEEALLQQTRPQEDKKPHTERWRLIVSALGGGLTVAVVFLLLEVLG